jgi:hypothetical protein
MKSISQFAAVVLFNQWHEQKPSQQDLDSLSKFILQLVTTTGVCRRTILLALAYCVRIRSILSKKYSAEIRGVEYRLILVGLILANKVLDDKSYTNAVWSKLSKIPLHDVNKMENEFLKALNYKVWFKISTLSMFAKDLESLSFVYSNTEDRVEIQTLVTCVQDIEKITPDTGSESSNSKLPSAKYLALVAST